MPGPVRGGGLKQPVRKRGVLVLPVPVRDVPADGVMRVELAEPLHAFFRVGQGGVRAAGRLDVGEQGERSEEHTSELQSRQYLVCRLLLEKKKHLATDPYCIGTCNDGSGTTCCVARN